MFHYIGKGFEIPQKCGLTYDRKREYSSNTVLLNKVLVHMEDETLICENVEDDQYDELVKFVSARASATPIGYYRSRKSIIISYDRKPGKS